MAADRLMFSSSANSLRPNGRANAHRFGSLKIPGALVLLLIGPLLLVAAGGESSDPAAVWPHAGEGGGAAVVAGIGASLGGRRAATPSTSSLIAIDCSRNRGYVPLAIFNSSSHGQIAVLDLSVNPDKANPLLNVIDIKIQALPRGMAADVQDGLLLVPADNGITTGTFLLIDESSFKITAVPLPPGSRPDETDGVVFDPVTDTALVSLTDAPDCPVAGSCTGQAVFDLARRTFGPLLQWEVSTNFAVNFVADTSLATSDDTAPLLIAVNLPKSQVCTFADENISGLNKDTEGIGVDPTTNIWVVGNFDSSTATVVNLNGSTFTARTDCSLNEAGSLPNSINFDTGTHAFGMPGVTINPFTHEALMTAKTSKELALLDLPSLPVKQIASRKVSAVHSNMPDDPDGQPFAAATFPYGDSIDICHNLGYVLENSRNYLAQIDLSRLKKRPASISSPLPAGSCFGAPTAFKCSNGFGVKFFRLPQ